MKLSIDRGEGLLTITQRFYPAFLLYFIRVTGIFLFTGGLLGLIGELHASLPDPSSPLTFFSGDILTVNMIFTIGMAMVYTGFSPASILKYTEKIIFDIPSRKVEYISPSSTEKPVIIPFGDILTLFRFKQAGADRGRDNYSVSMLLKDGAEFWITGNEPDKNKINGIASEISSCTALPYSETLPQGITAEEKKSVTSSLPGPEHISQFIIKKETPDGTVFILRKKPYTISGILVAGYIYLSLFTVPFFLMNIFLQGTIPSAVHYALYVFIFLWWGIFTGGIIISMKDFALKVNGYGITITIRLKFLPVKIKEIFIPREIITSVRTNRFENGISTLSLGLPENFHGIGMPARMFINASVTRKRRTTGNPSGMNNTLHLWELQPSAVPGKGPYIDDIRILEAHIQAVLGI